MILYAENAKDGQKKKLLEVINEFGKVTGYKISIQKSVMVLYTNDKLMGGKNECNPIYNSTKKQ